MKKIIATVLAMVMALALCTVAFAAETQKYDAYDAETGVKAYASKYLKYVKGDSTATPKTISYYELFEDADLTNSTNAKFVPVSKATDADYVLKYEGKDTVAMYLATVTATTYVGNATPYTDLGKKCGQYNYKAAGYTDSNKFYTAVNDDGDNELFVKGGNVNMLVDGKIVGMTKIGADGETLADVVVPHIWVLDVPNMTAKCSECGATAKLYEKYAEVPTGADSVKVQGYFLVADKTPTKPGDSTTKPSPKTFDAGIAMYVGMALTSVAGSAVVIGKKKEF